ncbi:MAG TPA: bifunctional riboflavin kinase/FAD synthetase [Acidimicrobiaceae bacterium]|nr:bifunctional riboflavin kinase/FAD synthetase [Acidimicrobiaceae bacterium]
MDVLRYPLQSPPPTLTPSAVAIGFFDGVHLGHQAVLSRVQALGAEQDLPTTVVTFDAHPAQVLRPESAPRLLVNLEQKLELLASTGVERTLVITFDEDRASESPEHFVDSVLVGAVGAQLVVVGEDFHFGHRRAGNVSMLREMGQLHGFEVVGLSLVGRDGSAARPELQVSSTAIRRALAERRLSEANAMLGRPHEMRGPVVLGDQRGRTIGFPTANVAVGTEMLLPADGIYAGHLGLSDGSWMPAAIYVGKRPTFYKDAEMSLLEVHCIGFSGDLYGQQVAVRFEHHLRADARFGSVEELAQQLADDVVLAERLLCVSDVAEDGSTFVEYAANMTRYRSEGSR